MKRLFSIIISQVPLLLLAAPSDHGRPWDSPGYHDSPLSKLFIPFGIIALIILAIGWLGNNKEKVGNFFKNGFAVLCIGALIFGFVILPLLDKADRSSSSASTTPTNTVVPNTSATINSNVPSNNSATTNSYSTSENSQPKEGEIGYKTKTYRIDVCRTCKGTGRYSVNANWGHSEISCPTCHGTGRERIAGNYR